MAGSLFDRLTRGEEGARMDEDESIRLHLLRLLTTRQGAVQSLPDYGLPDLNDLTLSRAELIAQTCAGIEECVRQYEPRLSEVEVTPALDEEMPFTMGIHIQAVKIGVDGSKEPWQWNLNMDGNRIGKR